MKYIFFLILSLTSCLSNQNVSIDGNSSIRASNDLNFNYLDSQSTSRLNVQNKRMLLSKTSQTIDLIPSNLKNSVTLLSVKSQLGNQTSLAQNKVIYTNIQNSRIDILSIQYRYNNRNIVENIEVRFAVSSKICYGLYLAGDNNLNGGDSYYNANQDYVKKDLSEMINVSFNNKNISVIVFLDTQNIAVQSYSNGLFQQVGIYLIDNGRVTFLRPFSEPNTGNPEWLKFFLNTMNDFIDAEKYILDIWSHGYSIFGVGFDTGSNDDSITPNEARKAISESRLGKVDVVNFSACLMMDIGFIGNLGSSNGSEALVQAFAGSADSVPGDGDFYGNRKNRGVIGYLSDNPNLTTNEIAKKLSEINFNSYYNADEQLSYIPYETFSSSDTTKLKPVLDALKDLFTDKGKVRANIRGIFQESFLSKTIFYSDSRLIMDIGSMANNIVNDIAGFKDNILITKAKSVVASLSEYVTFYNHRKKTNALNDPYSQKGIGIGIMFNGVTPTSIGDSWIRSAFRENYVYSYIGWDLVTGSR